MTAPSPRLGEISARLAAATWQPIETAPKDRQIVWLAGNAWGDPKNGWWVTRGSWRTLHGETRWFDTDHIPTGLYPPTHWMPDTPPAPPGETDADVAWLLAERDALRALLWRAWREMNAIRAETGAPLGYDGMTRCAYQHWHDLVEDCRAALGDDALPWETPAAKALTDRAEKLAEARSADLVAALGEVTQEQAAAIARLTAEAAAVRAAAIEAIDPRRVDEMIEEYGGYEPDLKAGRVFGTLTMGELVAALAAIRALGAGGQP